MKTPMKRIISLILVIVLIATGSLAGLAEAVGGGKQAVGDMFEVSGEIT